LLRPGETFYSEIDNHLWVVLTEPDDSDKVVCVCFLTQEAWTDPTTLCDPGEHRFFRDPTAVGYNFAVRYTVKRITNNLSGGSFKKKEPCSEELFQKVYKGLFDSDRTPNFVLTALGG